MYKTSNNSILKDTILIIFVGILAKFSSFISEVILAAYLGVTYQSDAYYMIWSIHSVVYPMMSIGIWQVFLPLYKSYITKNEKEKAFALTNKSLSFFIIFSCLIVLLLFIFAPVFISIVAPGFQNETKKLCIKLVRISAPMYIFIVASSVYASILQCHNKFFGSQIREVVSHIPTILAAIFFYKTFGIEVMAIALVVAAISRLFIEFPFISWGYKFHIDYKFNSSDFKLMLKRLPSALISAGVAQLNALIDKSMASTLKIGTISILNYGHKLTNVFSGLLSSAVATALYPHIIELITMNKKDELDTLMVKIISIFCVIMCPITIALCLFRRELVSVVFQHGAFDASSTEITANVFALYSLGLLFIASSTVINNIFYGYGNTKTPMYISLVNLVINVILNLLFIKFWKVNGLALATSLSAIIIFFIRLNAAKKYVTLNKELIITTVIKVSAASLIAFIIPRTIFCFYSMNKYLVLINAAVIGLIVYMFIIKLLNVKEFNDLVVLLKLNKKAKDFRS